MLSFLQIFKKKPTTAPVNHLAEDGDALHGFWMNGRKHQIRIKPLPGNRPRCAAERERARERIAHDHGISVDEVYDSVQRMRESS